MSRKITFQHLLPQHILSRLAGKLANCSIKQLKNFLIDMFIKAYKIDLSSALEENPHNYLTFNDFFTRKLKANARPIASEEKAIISPVDGTILQLGKIGENQLINAKGFDFTPSELLGTNNTAAIFKNGYFAVIYLSPNNYHRVHAPINGKLLSMTYVPGCLFSVNPKVLKNIPTVFARNERVINLFETEFGTAAVVLIGAMIVGSIDTAWAGTVTPNANNEITTWNYADQNITLEKGEELGLFKFGSTVILLFPENSISWNPNLHEHTPIQMGELLGIG